MSDGSDTEKRATHGRHGGSLRKNPLLKIFLEQHAKKAYNNIVKEFPLLESPEEEGVEIEDKPYPYQRK